MAAVIVHGGAYAIPDSIAGACEEGCREAAQQGYKALKEGKSALDAVEAAVRSLENNPVFNAGHGACLNSAGEVEMDAIISDGSSLKFGAVAGIRDISNPVSLARLIMEKTNHVMLIGEGANQFAAEMGVPKVDPAELITPRARKIYEDYNKFKSVVSDVFKSETQASAGHDTVGAVAIDARGNIAAATSTGGISLKRVGRVGDSSMIGSGAFSDNSLGGVSCTGHGEAIAKVVLAYRALSQLWHGKKGNDFEGVGLEEAMAESLGYMLERVSGRGGMIGISSNGMIAKHFTTPRMSWASVDKDGTVKSGI